MSMTTIMDRINLESLKLVIIFLIYIKSLLQKTSVPQHLLKNKLVDMSKFCLLSLNNRILFTMGRNSSKQFQKKKEYYIIKWLFIIVNFIRDQALL
jgi:hypothetical protein